VELESFVGSHLHFPPIPICKEVRTEEGRGERGFSMRSVCGHASSWIKTGRKLSKGEREVDIPWLVLQLPAAFFWFLFLQLDPPVSVQSPPG
jgi:hypothetical protein